MHDDDGQRDPTAIVGVASPLPIISGKRAMGGAAPVGLALAFDGRGRFHVQLWSEAGRAPLLLGPYEDEDVIAAWRTLAAVSGLPLLLPGADGSLSPPYPQLGRLLLGPTSTPKRLAVLAGRRPRFLTKRRAAVLPRRPRVHREPELASGHAP